MSTIGEIDNEGFVTLYHGTSSTRLAAILKSGLHPRGKGRRGNWKGRLASKRLVYLSTWLPVYFATTAAGEDGAMVVLRVRAPVERLLPDEDILRMAQFGDDADPREYRAAWNISLKELGTVATTSVEPEEILDFRTLPDDALLWTLLGGDASVNTLAYRIKGPEYMQRLDLFFREGPEAVLKTWNPEVP